MLQRVNLPAIPGATGCFLPESAALRIAVVTDTCPPRIDSVALGVERIAGFLRGRGHEVDLICPRERHDVGRPARERTDAPAPFRTQPRFGLASIDTLRRRLRSERSQLVHVATSGPLGRAAVLAANSLRLPLTMDFSAGFGASHRFRRDGWIAALVRQYQRRLHNRADMSFVPTRALHDELSADGFQRLQVIGRGVDAALFQPSRRNPALRAAWDAADPRQRVMLYVGRLAPEKDVPLALRAFAAIRYLHPDTRMVVVGSGPLRARLQAQFPDAYFAGEQRGDALAQHYASADLFVYPGRHQTFGDVTLEAMASGLAVVAFDRAAAAEHVHDGEDGVLVAPALGDAGFIAAAARAAALAEPDSPLRLRARAAALGARWDGVLRELEQQWLRLAHEESRPQRRAHAVPA